MNQNDGTANYTQYLYDMDGRKIKAYTGLSNPLVVKGFNNVTEGTDTEYLTTTYEYNYLGKLSRMYDSIGYTERYNLADSYDLNGMENSD